MLDDRPVYISTASWADLISRLACDDALRERIGVKLCPFTGEVEEYLVADELGGMLDLWPEKWRQTIEAGREVEKA